MEEIRHIALGCCVISTIAGMVRVFWPENNFAPVINAVLALYIITAALQMVRGTDWKALTAEIYQLTDSVQQNTETYEKYGYEIGLSASAEAIRSVLEQAGIEAAVQIQGETCCITLLHPSDKQRAEAILAESCGTLAYEIVSGGEKP